MTPPTSLDRNKEAVMATRLGETPMKRPEGSNADEWAVFLEEHKDASNFVAVQIAEAIDGAARNAEGAPGVFGGLKNLLAEAMREIQHLRRANEILGAKVEVVEAFSLALRAPGCVATPMAPDVAWALQRKIDELNAGPRKP